MLNGLQIHALLPAVQGDPAAKQFIQANLDPVKYRFLLLGLTLVTVMAVRPEGLFPSREQRVELHRVETTGEEPEALEAATYESPM